MTAIVQHNVYQSVPEGDFVTRAQVNIVVPTVIILTCIGHQRSCACKAKKDQQLLHLDLPLAFSIENRLHWLDQWLWR